MVRRPYGAWELLWISSYPNVGHGRELMSLTSRVNGRGPVDKDLRELLKSTMPDKALFRTHSNRKAFAGSEYEMLAPYQLSSRGYAGIVGSAFDYLARVLVARAIRDHKSRCLRLTVAERGLRLLDVEYRVGEEVLRRVNTRYADSRCRLNYFIHEQDDAPIEQIISICCFLARLDHLARQSFEHQLPYMETTLSALLSDELSEITEDLERLSGVFSRRFIDAGFLSQDSAVMFNPCFMSSHLLGGADADIVIDGTLYDLKTSKEPGYKWQDVAQLWGYYLLSRDDGTFAPMDLLQFYDGPLLKGGITRLAFYRARFGEIEYVDIDQIDQRTADEAVVRFMDYLDSTQVD
jgi:hypothetical protein